MYLYITCMCSLFHLALGNEDGGVQIVYESACCLAWGAIFDRRKDSGAVCVFSIFNAGGSVRVCECVYTHTHVIKVILSRKFSSAKEIHLISFNSGTNPPAVPSEVSFRKP